MRIAARAIGLATAVMLLILISCLCWLYFDSRGLPEIESFRALVSPDRNLASVPCLAARPIVVSYDSIGEYMRYALSATETAKGSTSVFISFIGGAPATSMVVARKFHCDENENHFRRQLDEIRLAVQLERHYSPRDLLAILANSTYLGEGTVGVEAASQRFFAKSSSNLSLSEAALIAGLASHPAYYSPAIMPDRASQRCYAVEQIMRDRQLISIRGWVILDSQCWSSAVSAWKRTRPSDPAT